MKKIIIITIVLAIILSFSSCKGNKDKSSQDNTSALVTEQQTNTVSKTMSVAQGEEYYEYDETDDCINITMFDPGYDENGELRSFDKVIIPDTIDGKKVLGIGSKDQFNAVFALNPSLVSIEISDTVVTIGNDAFKNLSSLTEVSGGSNISFVGENAFSLCEKLKTPDFLSNGKVEFIGKCAFLHCLSMSGLIDLSSVREINEVAFGECSGGLTIVANKGSAIEKYFEKYSNLCEQDGLVFKAN